MAKRGDGKSGTLTIMWRSEDKAVRMEETRPKLGQLSCRLRSQAKLDWLYVDSNGTRLASDWWRYIPDPR